MKGFEQQLVSFMQGCDKRFVIPVYQRNYDWKTEQCEQLFNDLEKTINENKKSHFFGSIVSVANGDFNNHIIIDGQQRLTTITILLLALYHCIINGHIRVNNPSLQQKIYDEYLVDKYKNDEEKIKLKPVKNDQKALVKLFKGEESEFDKSSNITNNYMFFFWKFISSNLSADDFCSAISRLEIINITLNDDDNPQLIFESLNSTGLALSEGDKIRNFILMNLRPVELQEKYYEEYWNKIEENTNYNVSLFTRDYLSIKLKQTPSLSKIYLTFKEFVEDNKLEVEPLLKDLLAYSLRYKILLKGSSSTRKINGCIARLNRLETTVTRPFFLDVLKLYEEGIITEEELSETFKLTESYLFRRTICGIPTNALNKIFLYLNNDIYKYENNYSSYLDKLKYSLLSKKDSSVFPDDREFVENFSQRPIYQMAMKNKIYILERFENRNTLEDKDIYRHHDEGSYSIEHIMPQTLNNTWIKELGENYHEVHDNWVHRLANLTLTAYNSRYSNSSFSDKLNMEDGFKHSGLRINEYVKDQSKWTETELEERNNLLMAQALTIWPYPSTNFTPDQKIYDSVTLDEAESLSGRLVTSFRFKGVEQKVRNWLEMFEKVMNLLHIEDKSILYKLADSKIQDNDLSLVVTRDKSKLRAYLELEPNLYVEKNTSTDRKLNMLRKFFELYNESPSDLEIYLADEKTEEN